VINRANDLVHKWLVVYKDFERVAAFSSRWRESLMVLPWLRHHRCLLSPYGHSSLIATAERTFTTIIMNSEAPSMGKDCFLDSTSQISNDTFISPVRSEAIEALLSRSGPFPSQRNDCSQNLGGEILTTILVQLILLVVRMFMKPRILVGQRRITF